MVLNPRLEEVVLKNLYRYISSKDEKLKEKSFDNEYLGITNIKQKANVRFDSHHRIIIEYSNLVGYGHDFNNASEEEKKKYISHLELLKEGENKSDNEIFLDEGNRHGYHWYITEKPSPKEQIKENKNYNQKNKKKKR